MAEKGISEVPRAWREFYEKGRAALDKNNLDYAMQLFAQVLEKEPAFYDCREALRATQFKRAAGGGGGFLKRVLGTAHPKLMQAQVGLKTRPLEAIQAAEQVLNNDPNNAHAHKVLADAAMVAGLAKTAVLSLEILAKQSPRDHDIMFKLAKALSAAGQAGRAESYIGELARAHPDDPEIAQALKDISASRTLSEGGYDALAGGEGSYRDVLRDEHEAEVIEQEHREHKSDDVTARLIAEYEARIPTEPQNQKLLRSIAELYAQKKDYDRALQYYEHLLSMETGDPTLERAMTDLRARKLDLALELLDSTAPDYGVKAEQLKAAKQAFLLEDCQRRVERYPNDLQLRFELGQLFWQAGRLNEAIQEFQKAQNNPHKRIQALYHLGLCFAKRGMPDLAARTFQNAIKEKLIFDDEKKELIYALGGALEKMAKKEEAIEQFKLIYEVDIGYRDVAAKIDAYYGSQAG